MSETKKAVKTAHKENESVEKPIMIGRQSDGSIYGMTLKDMGSMIIGGVSGSGKSGLLQNIVNQAKEQAQVLVVDGKKIGFMDYKGQPNCHVITKMEQFPELLQRIVQEITSRYEYMEKMRTTVCPFGHILVIVDELAEAMIGLTDHEKDQIRQILSLGRQCRITMICATQSPSRRLLSGAIVDMFTTRCGLRTSSVYASKIILETSDAARIPKYSAIISGVSGFKTQIRLLPPPNEKNGDEDGPHDTIDWNDD